jgi:hypothetical protein
VVGDELVAGAPDPVPVGGIVVPESADVPEGAGEEGVRLDASGIGAAGVSRAGELVGDVRVVLPPPGVLPSAEPPPGLVGELVFGPLVVPESVERELVAGLLGAPGDVAAPVGEVVALSFSAFSGTDGPL